ncbi:MAG: hypothetical protein RIA63_09435, partial [Cyclobacteriaceae bacterium]
MFLNRDLESNIALNCLLPDLQKHTFNIFLSEKVGGKISPIPQLQQLAILEREFVNSYLFPKLEATMHGGFLSFDQISKKHRAPLSELTELTSATTLAQISKFRPDLFISIRFG